MYTRPVSKENLITFLENQNENLLILKPDQLAQVLHDIVHTVIHVPAAEKIAAAVLVGEQSQHPAMREALQLINKFIIPCIYQFGVMRDIFFGFESMQPDYFRVFEQIRLALIKSKRCLLFVDEKLKQLLADLMQEGFAYQAEITALFTHDAMHTYLSKHHSQVSDDELIQAKIKLFREKLQQLHRAYPQYDVFKIMLEIYKKPMAIGQVPLLEERLLPLFQAEKKSILAGYNPALSKKVKANVSFDKFSLNHDKHPEYEDSVNYYYKMLVTLAPKIAHEYVVDLRNQIKLVAAERLQWFKELVDHEGKTLLKAKDPVLTAELMQMLRAQDELYVVACEDFGCKPEKQFKLADRMQLILQKGLSNQVGMFAMRNKVDIPHASLNAPENEVFRF